MDVNARTGKITFSDATAPAPLTEVQGKEILTLLELILEELKNISDRL